jgi:hypothetical protein
MGVQMARIVGGAQSNAATKIVLFDGFKADLSTNQAPPTPYARLQQPSGMPTRRRSSEWRADQASLKSQTADPAITRGATAQTFTLQDLSGSKYKLGSRFDKLVDSSASLRGALKELQSRGFRVEIGLSTFTNMKQKTVTLAQSEFSRLDYLASSLSHELGHVTNANRYADFRDRNSYIRSSLAGEGAAVLFNLKVRQELLDAGQGDIGVLGQPAFGKQAVQDWNSAASGRISLNQLHEKLATGYATQHPQIAADQNYAEFFGTEFDALTRYHPEYVGKVFRGSRSDSV